MRFLTMGTFPKILADLATAQLCILEAGKTDAVRLLLERGADKQIKDTAGWTAKEVAVTNGHNECARLLE